ncbi:hypothetical protein F383_35226 [Gossypium arboreum]|uniref:Uncharacterized protein n=1 Tax=Gossypium arboreum TaxID=29729 RepID=A0A0B0N7M5_GOSAR|nr:hypothetical protein F383_35226 [Gossypium arboreum]
MSQAVWTFKMEEHDRVPARVLPRITL